jgi:hypothetical protein
MQSAKVTLEAVQDALRERLGEFGGVQDEGWSSERLAMYGAGYADTVVTILLDIAALVVGEEAVEQPDFSAADITPTMIDTVQDPLLIELCQLLDLDLWQGEQLALDRPLSEYPEAEYRAGERAAITQALMHVEALRAKGSLLRSGKMSISFDRHLGHALTPVQDLFGLSGEMERAAGDHGLIVVRGVPDVSQLPSMGYAGDWRDFLALAAHTHARLLYLERVIYDPDVLALDTIPRERGPIPGQRAGLIRQYSDDAEDNEGEDEGNWLGARLRAALSPWDDYRGTVAHVCGIWCHEGVAHVWQRETEWHVACNEALLAAYEEARQADREDRRNESKQHAQRLQELAVEMARHPRFAEATSDAKRTFMAEQLFGDILRSEPLSYTAEKVAARAHLIYWWDIEPAEWATQAERVRELRTQGKSIRHIAAELRMSEARVRAASSEEA